jgi:hypothetical protein
VDSKHRGALQHEKQLQGVFAGGSAPQFV